MVRIGGVDIPSDKRIEIALAYIYGIGRPLAHKILNQARVDFGKKAKDLAADEITRIREIMEKNCKVEGELKREVMMNIKRLKDVGAWRGLRHIRGLPARGQRTRTNSRTRRGNVRKTMASGRRRLEKK